MKTTTYLLCGWMGVRTKIVRFDLFLGEAADSFCWWSMDRLLLVLTGCNVLTKSRVGFTMGVYCFEETNKEPYCSNRVAVGVRFSMYHSIVPWVRRRQFFCWRSFGGHSAKIWMNEMPALTNSLKGEWELFFITSKSVTVIGTLRFGYLFDTSFYLSIPLFFMM